MTADLIEKFGRFTEHDKLLFEQVLVRKEVHKNNFLLREGEVCQSSFYIIEGAFIQYNFKDEIDQNIIDLHLENEWVLNQQSFVRQQPSATFIQAFNNTVVYELTVQKMHELIAKSPAFFQLGKILEPAHSRIQLFDNQLTPSEKYQFVLENRIGLLQTFPLKIIASYLKITPETLSRVREKISREKNHS
jgi:CRP-like cAMP-binding protein